MHSFIKCLLSALQVKHQLCVVSLAGPAFIALSLSPFKFSKLLRFCSQQLRLSGSISKTSGSVRRQQPGTAAAGFIFGFRQSGVCKLRSDCIQTT